MRVAAVERAGELTAQHCVGKIEDVYGELIQSNARYLDGDRSVWTSALRMLKGHGDVMQNMTSAVQDALDPAGEDQPLAAEEK
jgi:hypothetical protein